MMINYASPVPPENYKCATCGAHGCKLWRESARFGPVALLCVTCAGKAEGVDVSAADDAGRVPWKLGPARTDQIGSHVPAVPHPTGSFWGYTSVPDEGVKWWKALPTRGGVS